MHEVFHVREGAAAYIRSRGLPCTKLSLQKFATVGGGPRYQLFGNKAVYTEQNLDRWIEEKLSPLRDSTSVLAKEASSVADKDDDAAEEEARRRDEGEDEQAEIDAPAAG